MKSKTPYIVQVVLTLLAALGIWLGLYNPLPKSARGVVTTHDVGAAADLGDQRTQIESLSVRLAAAERERDSLKAGWDKRWQDGWRAGASNQAPAQPSYPTRRFFGR